MERFLTVEEFSAYVKDLEAAHQALWQELSYLDAHKAAYGGELPYICQRGLETDHFLMHKWYDLIDLTDEGIKRVK